jgi:tRNA-Thr(GGU) m(6)t(6)A37 methyltransferase TsaA
MQKRGTGPIVLEPIGVVRSPLTDAAAAPKQGFLGSPEAWIELDERFAAGLDGIAAGDEIMVLTWLDRASRDVLRTHPRDDRSNPERGVFSTRSPARPNPIGLHRVRVLEADGTRLLVGDLEALDGTPVVDIKPVLHGPREDGS